MIERLVGTCALRHAGGIILDVNGVGYGVEMTPAAIAQMQDGSTLTVWVHTHVSQDALRLFGFLSVEERHMFSLLLTVSGLGPKLAMAVIATFTPDRLVEIIQGEEAKVLEEVPGIGPRQSKKFLLELKPKIERQLAAGTIAPPVVRVDGAAALQSAPSGRSERLDAATLRDLQSALENFGYRDKELVGVLRRFERTPPARTLPELLRLALAELSGQARVEGAVGAEELF